MYFCYALGGHTWAECSDISVLSLGCRFLNMSDLNPFTQNTAVNPAGVTRSISFIKVLLTITWGNGISSSQVKRFQLDTAAPASLALCWGVLCSSYWLIYKALWCNFGNQCYLLLIKTGQKEGLDSVKSIKQLGKYVLL